MECIFEIMMSQLKLYKAKIMSSAYSYYWTNKGPDYLNLLLLRVSPRRTMRKHCVNMEDATPCDDSLERECRWAKIIEEIEKRDKLLPNELFITLSSL